MGVPAVVRHSKKSSPAEAEEHDQERPPTTWQPLAPAALSLAEALFGEDFAKDMEQQRLLQLAEGLYRH